MSVKTSDETIKRIRDMRAKLYSISFIANALDVSTFVVTKYTEDMNICLRGNKKAVTYVPYVPKNLFEPRTFHFSELSPELQEYYLSLTPPVKNLDNDTMITASKGDYGKAVVFEDYRANFGV